MKNAARREVDELRRLKEAVAKTKSPYLKRDYEKKIAKIEKGLKTYCYLYGRTVPDSRHKVQN